MSFSAKYVHTNIVSSDWEKLARFYEKVFGCIRVLPKRDLSGKWIDNGTGINDAHIRGIHLQLPGYDNNGPTLEIFQYNKADQKIIPRINRPGLAHIAFRVDDIDEALNTLLSEGGSKLGEVVSKDIEDIGYLTFVYTRDPEGNIIELQHLSSSTEEQ